MKKRMTPRYRNIRLQQLARSLDAFRAAKEELRPPRGWLNSIREVLGWSADDVAQRLHIGRARILTFERAEAEDRITLHSLMKVADAMGCDLVYAVVPKTGTIQELAEQQARAEATRRVLSVERNMALENQAAGNIDQRIEEETKRILEKE